MDVIRLRPYKECDANDIAGWISDEKSFYQWSANKIGIYPMTAEVLNNYYKKFKCNNCIWQMTACDAKNVPIGHLTMGYKDETLQTLRFGFVIIDDKLRGKGFGKQILRLAIKYSFEILKVEKITLGVFANNPNAYYCYLSLGFVEIVKDKRYQFEINGEQWECIEMELNRSRWELIG